MLTWGLLRPDQTWAAQRDAAMKPALDTTLSAGVIAHCLLHLQQAGLAALGFPSRHAGASCHGGRCLTCQGDKG